MLVILADEKGDAALECKREQKEPEQHCKEQVEETDRELSDCYNRSGGLSKR